MLYGISLTTTAWLNWSSIHWKIKYFNKWATHTQTLPYSVTARQFLVVSKCVTTIRRCCLQSCKHENMKTTTPSPSFTYELFLLCGFAYVVKVKFLSKHSFDWEHKTGQTCVIHLWSEVCFANFSFKKHVHMNNEATQMHIVIKTLKTIVIFDSISCRDQGRDSVQ